MGDIVSIDVGATNIRIALFDRDGGEVSEIHKDKIDHADFMGQIYRVLDRQRKFDGIGIAVPGRLAEDGKVWVYSPNMRGVTNLPVVDILSKKYRTRVRLSNDAVAAVTGEWRFGAGKGMRNVAYLTLSTGIGAGVVADGRPLSGKDGNAHEVGHCTIDASGAMRCACGSYGHWEAYCSGSSIPRFAELLMRTKFKGMESKLRRVEGMDAEDVYGAAAHDKVAAGIVEEVGRLNAIGIANLINTYDPEIVTIGGGVALNNRKAVLEPILRHINEYKFNRIPPIEITPLGEKVVFYGAVAGFM